MRVYLLLLKVIALIGPLRAEADVSDIVAAINEVQKNVPNANKFVPNVKVAKVNKHNISAETTIIKSTITNSNQSETSKNDVNKNLTGISGLTQPDVSSPLFALIQQTTYEDNEVPLDYFSGSQNSNLEEDPIKFILSQTASVEKLQQEDPPTDVIIVETTDLLASEQPVQPVPSSTAETNTTAELAPPAYPHSGILSYSGMNEWAGWVSDMRNPEKNPNGVPMWPVVIYSGLIGLAQHYSPTRYFSGRVARALDSADSAINVYEHREDIIKALRNNEIEPTLKDVITFSRNLERKKIVDRIEKVLMRASKPADSNGETTTTATAAGTIAAAAAAAAAAATTTTTISTRDDESIFTGLTSPAANDDKKPESELQETTQPNQLYDLLTGLIELITSTTTTTTTATTGDKNEETELEETTEVTRLFDLLAGNTDQRGALKKKKKKKKKKDVIIINLLIKSAFALAGLAAFSYSGVENFFIAPLPPDMDSLSGRLRFWGLQALLGPDYLVDYDPPLSDEEYAEDEDEEYDYEDEPPADAVRTNEVDDGQLEDLERKKRRSSSKKKFKHKNPYVGYYKEVPHSRKPPSNYGSSYSSYMRAGAVPQPTWEDVGKTS